MPARNVLLRAGLIGVALALAGCDAGVASAKRTATAEGSEPRAISVQPAPDREIEERLTGIFGQIEGLGDVRVRVRDGVVHLDGSTETATLERQAVGLAERVEGVAHVDEEITLPSGAGAFFAPMGRTLQRMARGALAVLPRVGAALIVLLPFALLALLLGRWRRPLHVFGVSSLSGGITRAALRWITFVVGLLLALDVLGIVGIVGAVFGALGLLGLVAGFVFKDWVADYLPGVLLGMHPPFRAGDLVQIGSHEGRVVRITPHVTVLMTPDGEEVRVPNSKSFRETMINFSQHRERRLRFPVTLAPQADLRLAQDLGRRALLSIRGVLAEPPPFMRTRTLERNSIEVEFFAWVDQEVINFRTAESTAKRVVFTSLAEHGLPLPEERLIVHQRSAPAPRGQLGPQPSPVDPAEDRDQAFVDEQLKLARAAVGERDLLSEASSDHP